MLNISDGTHPRCLSAIIPSGSTSPMPILFDFHGAGGNAGNFGMRRSKDGSAWLALAMQHKFTIVGGEALQFTGGDGPGPGPAPGPPPPSPVPQDCIQCFGSKGCQFSEGEAKCRACMTSHQFGPDGCSNICGGEHVPFPAVEKAVCGAPDDVQDAEGGHWHGGQWLIPEVQTDATGLVCDWENNLDLRYINASLAALEREGAKQGGRVFALDKIFFTGCSMGSAYTVWLAQCVHEREPASVTAFASQSTGLKVKGDGLQFPPDNYLANETLSWGECPACQYFPAPVSKTNGLKACVVDQTGDPAEGNPTFYKSSLALHAAWTKAGMKTEANYTAGGHCQTGSFEWIARCLDDGTGRLLGDGR